MSSNLILDEEKIVKDIIEHNTYDKENIETYNALSIIVKYYYLQGMRKESEIRYKVLDLFESMDEYFIITKWNKTVEKITKSLLKRMKFFNNELELIKVEQVKIYSKELEYLNNIKSIQIRKILFICLIYAKIFKEMKRSDKGWFNLKSFSKILKLAKCKVGNEDYRLDLLGELKQKKYIMVRKKNGNYIIKIDFINDIETEDNKLVMVIEDFENAIYQYLNYLGGNWKQCECGKYFKYSKSKPKQKYCVSCSKEKQKEQQRASMKKLRNYQNVK